MSYFNKDFLEFFKELAKNNNKKWFDANRKRYEVEVREPFKEFVDLMILRIKKYEPELTIDAKEAIFRINRDIRFSRDKRPYQTHVSANISRGGRKSPDHAGFYFQFSHDRAMLGGGAYHVEKDGLHRIRTNIAGSLKKFDGLVNDQDFKKKYGEVQGEKNKRLPVEFQEVMEKQPLIANKHFYYMADLKPGIVLKSELPDVIMDYYSAGRKFNRFLDHALGNK